MIRRLLLSFATLVVSAGLCQAAFADSITFALNPPNQSILPGQTASFTGTITALSSNSGAFFLNGDSYTVPSPLVINDSPFFTNTPLFLAPGDTFTGVLFTIMAPTSSPIMTFLGTFNILGGSDSITLATAASANFTTTVTPEPTSWMLMGTGLFGLLVIARRTKSETAFLPLS